MPGVRPTLEAQRKMNTLYQMHPRRVYCNFAFWTGVVALLLLGMVSPAWANDQNRYSAISFQGGWWNAEAEWKSHVGVYATVGVPWVGWLLRPGSTKWMIPYGARIGYQYDAFPYWKLRGAAHVAGTYGRENPCGGCGEIVTRSFMLIELGLRYEYPTGFVVGLDAPLFAFDDVHELVRGSASGVEVFPMPLSLLFTQVYVGYSWRF